MENKVGEEFLNSINLFLYRYGMKVNADESGVFLYSEKKEVYVYVDDIIKNYMIFLEETKNRK